jgi:hypothetical protein
MKVAVPRPVLWTLFGAAWLGCVVAGLAALMNYDNSPGVAAAAPPAWPADSRLARDPAGPTLVLLAHPRCDCTRASVSELAELLARARQRPRTFVVFIKPGRVRDGWEQTALWRAASDIPGVTIVRDDQGLEAQRFGVETSGQVLLYGADGQLWYSGGTTGARGKTGANVGRAAVLAALDGERRRAASAPVFGCSLFGAADAPDELTVHAGESHAR